LKVDLFLNMPKKKLVVLSGAGISAESGLKTFRDSDGLWEGYNIEEVATPGAWMRDPALVLDFYNMRRRSVREAEPNDAHRGIAELEEHFDVYVITQNIDDLHERAGSSRVLHLHGEIFKMRSERDASHIVPVSGDIHLGDLAPDGGQYRPHIVWFGEPVPKMEEASAIAGQADLFVVIGTSLLVYPAAGLVHCCSPGIPRFVIDRSIPHIVGGSPVFPIEMPATSGIRLLQEKLADHY
jgi:NAD-dependent deacetylase